MSDAWARVVRPRNAYRHSPHCCCCVPTHSSENPPTTTAAAAAARPPAMSPPELHLVDELLEEIFLRLPTPATLSRASTASPCFRRIITDRSFLRRYRKLHPPPLLGFADDNGFHPVQAPHPSAPLARALADAADFTYSFVPNPTKGRCRWSPCDARDGRVLLKVRLPSQVFRVLAVCDPLSRRYVLIPSIPQDLATQEELVEVQSMLAPLAQEEELVEVLSMLAPVGDDDEDETSFRVISLAHYKSKLVAFVFSSVTGNWCVAASLTWTSLGTVQPQDAALYKYSHLHGCFYWTELWIDKLLVLDTRSMEFSTIDYFITDYHKQIMDQPGQSRRRSYVVAGGGGDEALEVFSLVADQTEQAAVHHTIQQINDQTSVEWRLEKIIPLPADSYCFASGAAEGFLFIGATTCTEVERNDNNPWRTIRLEDLYLSLDVQTSETTEVYRKKGRGFDCENVYWYFGLPPSLSKPTI